MDWQLSLNRPHLIRWTPLLVAWLAYVALALVLGAHLKPRLDEFLFVLSLPLWGIVPYAAWCLAVVALRAWLWPAHAYWRRLRLRLAANHRIGKRA